MGGRSKTTSTSKSSSASGSGQAWARPYAKEAAGNIQGVYERNQPRLEQLADDAYGFSNQLGARFNRSNEIADQAGGYYGDVLGGKYLNGNPYLEKIIGQMRSGVTDATNSQFTLGGRYGSGAHSGVLASKLADAESNLRYADYGQQMGRMDEAARAAIAANQGDAQQVLAGQALAGELPYVGGNAYANQLGSIMSGGTSSSEGTQTQKGPGLFSTLLGAGAQIGSAWLGSK